MSAPIKVSTIKFIDGKIIKSPKDKIKRGYAKGKGGKINFNLEEIMLNED